MIKAIERANGTEYKVKRTEDGFEIYTLDGELKKTLKESTFKRYYKVTGECVEEPKKKAKKKPEPKTKKPEQEVHEELSDEKREALIEKIRKIMKLAEKNPSMEEGLSAALKAQQLMAKYNIHKEDVELEEIKDEITSVFTQQKHNSHLKAWRKQLAVIIARNFRCKCYMHGKDVVFRGYRQDAEIALDVYLGLYNLCRRLASQVADKQKEETSTAKGAHNSFAAGFIRGVEEGLNEQCTALMIIIPPEVEEEYAEFASKNLKPGRAERLSVSDAELYHKGKIEGKAAVKARSIEKKGRK